ncbi:MAG: thioredoxin family protein [Cyanobacteriota bacterium]
MIRPAPAWVWFPVALTPSTMLPLGTPLPWTLMVEALRPVCGGPLPAADALEDQPVLVFFLCPHCPFVKHIEPELTRLQDDFGDAVTVVAIRSNSLSTHPQDGPAEMTAQATGNGWRFPYLADDSQVVARAFQAACTPDLYLFDGGHQLRYRGQLDGSRPGNAIQLDGRDLRSALTAVVAGQAPSAEQAPSIGCNIKWHPGQQPAWA